MTFRPTSLPFQLQERSAGEHSMSGPGPWRPHSRYATLEEAEDAIRTTPTNWTDLRVHCDPKDVSRVIYEAGIAIRMAGTRSDISDHFHCVLREREALEDRGPRHEDRFTQEHQQVPKTQT